MDGGRIGGRAAARWARAAVALVLGVGGIGALGAVGSVGLTAVGTSLAGAANGNHHGFNVSAFGTELTGDAGGATTGSGQSALMVISCTTATGVSRHNTTAGVNIAAADSTVGAVSNTGSTSRVAGGAADQGTSSVASVNLGGVVQANAIQAVANARFVGSGPSASGSSSLGGLTIAGKSYAGSVPANTTVPLPGIGSVVLNQQVTGATSGGGKGMTVNAIDVKVTVADNSIKLPVGAQLVVGHAFASVSAPVSGPLGTIAYGSAVDQGGAISSNGTFPQPLQCFGTGGKVVSNNGSGSGVSGVSAGAVNNTAQGTDTVNGRSATLSSTVHGLSITEAGQQLLAATLVRSVSHSQIKNGKLSRTDAGSQIGGLTVAGQAIPLSSTIKPNTTYPIPGVGSIILNRVINTKTGFTIASIDVHLTNAALVKLVGTDILVAVSQSHV